jgi:RNA polymerase sigma-70 factor, ECF subfamily
MPGQFTFLSLLLICECFRKTVAQPSCMEHLSDNEIIELIREGRVEAYQYLFEKHYEKLCVQAAFIVGDADAAEDVVQQAFIQFWEQKRYNQVQTSLVAYLASMVRHGAIDLIRKEKRGAEKLKSYASLLDSAEAADPIGLAELSREMNKAIEELPAQCRALFKAVYLDGKKYSEAAEEAGISVNTVKEQLRRAFRKMREKLKNMRYIL